MPKNDPIVPIPSLKITILLFEEFSNMVLACLLEPLRVVRDQMDADISWSVITHSDAPVASSSGLRITPDMPRDDVRACDVFIVVGGDRFREEAADASLRKSLRLAKQASVTIAADTGSWLLAAAGYLGQRKATIHWQILAEFAETFPHTKVSHDRYVRDTTYWTCGGASTALDLMLAFISERYSPAIALDASTMFVHDSALAVHREQSDGRLGAKGSERLRRVLVHMTETVEQPRPLETLARLANLSMRTLSRLFLDETGMSPGQYYQFLRLSRARDLATHTDLTLNDIAIRCGFSSASALGKAFTKRFGKSIGKSRETKPG